MATAIVSEPRTTARFAANDRIAGFAGLVFVAGVVFQNLVHAVIDPAGDATGAAILSHLADHRGLLEFTYGLFAIELVALMVFVGAIVHRLRETPAGWLARAGLLGVAGIVTLFAGNVVVEIALSASTGTLASSPHVVEALWAVHQAFFGLNFAAIGTALLGLSLASAAAGIVPRWFRIVGPVGAALLLIGALPTLQTAEGSMAGMAIALPGFVAWLAWMLFASVSVIQHPAAD